jgi:ATP phosphoribosyltransferase
LLFIPSFSPSSISNHHAALPNKGRLNTDCRDLLADAGLEVRASSERALTASLGGEFEAIFVRAQDIPEFVADGAADAGITGWDLVTESGRDLTSRLDLEFGKCRLVVAVREESGIRSLDDIAGKSRVATVFPNITRKFFADAGKAIDIVPVSGSVEVTPHLGIADIILDLTSTGSTLRVNGLREVATVLQSSARLITAAAPTSDADRARTLDELVMALASVLAARGQRYVMANVPRARLDEVKRVLPGISGPTVIDVMNGGAMVAVHAVAPAATIYRTITQLKALGGEGILVTRIERLLA